MEKRASVNSPDLTDSRLRAFLRLRQGASARGSWILDEVPGGTMISIGSDPSCDWQVRAAFVPPRAFSILLVGGAVFVRTGPEPGVLLNGKALDDGWVPVPNGARIDCGLARLEVTAGFEAPIAAEPTGAFRIVDTVPAGQGTWQAAPGAPIPGVPEASAPSAWDAPPAPAAAPTPTSSPRSRASQGSGARRRTTGSRDLKQTIRGHAPRPGATSQPLEVTRELEDVFTDPGAPDVVPALLEDEAPAKRSSKWRYAAFGVLTASAYGGWLVLLDRL